MTPTATVFLMSLTAKRPEKNKANEPKQLKELVTDSDKRKDLKIYVIMLLYSPKGAYLEKASTHMGLEGIISTIAAWPDLMNLGFSSKVSPLRLFTKVNNLLNLQAM
jgi:hypothetical protein